MKKELLRIGILCAIAGFTFSANAQEYIDKKITDKNGSVNLVTFKNGSNLKAGSKIDLFKSILNLSQDSEMKLLKSENDFTNNFVDEKYHQYYKGILVEFSGYNLHYNRGTLTSMNGEVFSTNNVNITPSITKEVALENAIKSVNASKYMWEEGFKDVEYNKKPTGELVLVPIVQKDDTYKLVLSYKFDIFAAEPISRANIYIDAVTGQVVLSDAIMKHSQTNVITLKDKPILTGDKDENLKSTLLRLTTGNADTRYSGSQSIETTYSDLNSNYILYDTTRGGGVRTYNTKKTKNIATAVDFTDNDNNWSAAEFDNANFDNAALDAHWGVAKTYDYFKNKFNRNSYNNLGTPLRSYVHFDNKYENAGWSGSYMIYGDGDTQFSPLTAFDVTAHELGHGVCSTTAALAYQRESGALNEGFSDIWGASVEHEYAPNKQAFLIGEDITKIAPMYLRSMSDPKSAGQPDTYKGENWSPATVAEGCITPGRETNDYCGVHNNSGVLNHWFYVLVQGKTGTNDIGKTYNVTGIGFDKASKIAYRLEVNYLSANSTFMNARDYGIQTAIDLFGANSPEMIATQDAFYAVGIGAKYNPNGTDTVAPSTPLNLQATSTTNVSTYLTWDASTDNFAMDGYNVYKDGTLVGSTNTNSLYVKGLSASTAYKFKVEAKDEAGNKSDFSNEITVTTLESGISYCTAQANNASYMRIKNVKLNTIDNTSLSSAGYEDFSYISTKLAKESTYSITVTPVWTIGVYPLRYTMYIDYNNNGVFTDENEVAWIQTSTPATPVTGTFKIPSTANLGKVRIRIVAAYGASSPACGNISYGQIEDYTAEIQESLAVSEINGANKTSIYPNPVKDVLFVKSNESGESAFTIYNTAGQAVSKGKSTESKIDVNNLSAGSYIIELTNNKGEKSTQKFIKK